MMKNVLITLVQSVTLTAAAVAVAVVTNAVRRDGIPLVTDIPYEIFSACKDADVVFQSPAENDIAHTPNALVVDARPRDQYNEEHVQDAINIPYSALFGAAAEDIETVRQEAKARKATAIVVYGTFRNPDNPVETVDFAKPLADQLLESRLENVRHVAGGLEAMKKQGAQMVKGK